MTTLENEIFTLTIDAEEGRFSIEPRDSQFPGFTGAFLGLTLKAEGESVRCKFENWKEVPESRQKRVFGPHGNAEMVAYEASTGGGVKCTFTFGILQETPLVVWKIDVMNGYSQPVWLEKIDLLKVKEIHGGKIIYPRAADSSDLGFYSNGWQSWSPTRWYAADDKMMFSKLGGLQNPMIYNPGTPRPKQTGQFSSDMFAVIGDRKARTGVVLGFLSQKEQFGSIYVDFQHPGFFAMWANCDDIRLDSGKSISTDWAVFNPILLDHRDPLDKYLEAVARENEVRIPAESPVGWCSWYHFYTHLSEQDVRSNLRSILDLQETLPVQLVQIDDGFESQVGDWFSFKPEFPNGVKPLADEISREGLIPGLWLAPFIVHPKSKLVKEHPEWLLRKDNGKPASAGFVWNALDYALDLTAPGALEYACSVIHTAATEWGFPYLKLDFLYAAALEGSYKDPTVTRAQVLRRGMEAIRAAAGREVTLLGCGAPLGSMLGLIEANRIGADVSGDWTPSFNGINFLFKSEPAMPSARNSIRNILTRALLHQHWWINDPDCLLVRPDTHLSLDEVRSLATAIALTGGSLLVSDDLPKLPADRLCIAEALLPVIGERARVIDWFDAEMPEMLRVDQFVVDRDRHILAKFNWSERPLQFELTPESYNLPDGGYHVREFWGGKIGKMATDVPFTITIPPHGCAVFTAQLIQENSPAYLGSDLHISQGMELRKWEYQGKRLEAGLRLPRKAKGHIYIGVPSEMKSVKVNDQVYEAASIAEKIYEIPVVVEGFCTLEISLK